MNDSGDQQIVPGISVTPSGQATVDPALTEVLFDLAIKLEEPTNLPVDVEHVLAAIVLAARNGELDPNSPLSSDAGKGFGGARECSVCRLRWQSRHGRLKDNHLGVDRWLHCS